MCELKCAVLAVFVCFASVMLSGGAEGVRVGFYDIIHKAYLKILKLPKPFRCMPLLIFKRVLQ